jgi:hypothetical protein
MMGVDPGDCGLQLWLLLLGKVGMDRWGMYPSTYVRVGLSFERVLPLNLWRLKSANYQLGLILGTIYVLVEVTEQLRGACFAFQVGNQYGSPTVEQVQSGLLPFK